MSLSFTLEGRAFSINKAYYASKKILTVDAKRWQESIYAQLAKVDGLLLFAENFEESPGPIELTLTFNYLQSEYYNKQGQVSSKIFDVDNCLKLLIDCIFSKLGINDKFVTRIIAEKGVGDRDKIVCTLKRVQ